MKNGNKGTIIVQSAITQFIAENFTDGDIVSHEWLHWALEIPQPKSIKDADKIRFLLLSRFDEFKKQLLVEKKIALRNIPGSGYLIVPPSDQAYYAAEMAMKGIQKYMDGADRILVNVRHEALSDSERRRHVDTQCRFDGIRGILKRQRRDVFRLFAPNTRKLSEM